MSAQPWQLWIDTGGTFTDCLAVSPTGAHARAKVLSQGAIRGRVEAVDADRQRLDLHFAQPLPAGFLQGYEVRFRSHDPEPTTGVARRVHAHETRDATGHHAALTIEGNALDLRAVRTDTTCEFTAHEEAPILAARILTGTALHESLPPLHLRLATTRGTNALLEHKGAAVAFFVTRGHRDLLTIGTQQRPDLFALNINRPDPLPARIIEVDERLGPDGRIETPLDLDTLANAIREARDEGITSAAIALMHSYQNPTHERELASYLREQCGFTDVSCASDLAPLIRLLPRAQTAVVNAYLTPIVGSYLDRIATHADPHDGQGPGSFFVMTSAGGLARASTYEAKDSLLSGPAGGVTGAAIAGRRSGFRELIAFDMGGTSTDVSRIGDDLEYVFEHEVGNAHLFAPALAIETVAAGGGSICRFEDLRPQVGPASAGADPGPACYGAGGPLTMTDVNLLLGRLRPSHFQVPLDTAHARAALDADLARMASHDPEAASDPDRVLEGYLSIANTRMAAAIRSISVRRGYDPATHALVAFGGAGPQHACAIARELGMSTVIVPPDAGLLSALGLGHAHIERFADAQILKPLDACDIADRSARAAALVHDAMRAVENDAPAGTSVIARDCLCHLRVAGQDSTIEIRCDIDALDTLDARFRARYHEIYGYPPHDDDRVEWESIRVMATTDDDRTSAGAVASPPTTLEVEIDEVVKVRFAGAWLDSALHRRADLVPGSRVSGPAIISEDHTCTVVEPGWSAQVDAHGALIVSRHAGDAAAETQIASGSLETELFAHRFASIAREAGAQLRRTARSTNVKERLDFSCAVLDVQGRLVVNAPHIPVHLGALGMCVRRVMDTCAMGPGDVVVTNHPGYGGSHLPDITVITGVFTDDDSPRCIGYVANRAHHAEIGGAAPGSMPPHATTLAEEGIVIEPMYLVRDGVAHWDEIEERLRGGPYPSRDPETNLADLRAAVASNQRAARGLRDLADRYGVQRVHDNMAALRGLATVHIEHALRQRGSFKENATERLDDGTRIHVEITLRDGRATIDFTGSDDVHPGNLNATPAIVRSATMYVLRLLISEPLPLNEGLLEPIEIRIRPGSLLAPNFDGDPAQAPAVVGGNVETSQRLVDTLLKAFGLVACSQGTMNNVLFGNDRFGYYETVCGGSGAGPGFAGTDAIQTHMTNTRMTDPEIIEHRYPVRVETFGIRPDSGGHGTYRGGHGTIRILRFLDDLRLSIVSQHRVERPFGGAGGESGQCGRQRIIRADGTEIPLESIDGCDIKPGDRLVLETPGGGGWGPA